MKINKNLQKRHEKMVQKLGGVGPFIEGTLTTIYIVCKSKGCACQRGQKHPSMRLTWKENKITKALYIPVAKRKQAIIYSKNYKKLKTLIRKISDLQKVMLKSG